MALSTLQWLWLLIAYVWSVRLFFILRYFFIMNCDWISFFNIVCKHEEDICSCVPSIVPGRDIDQFYRIYQISIRSRYPLYEDKSKGKFFYAWIHKKGTYPLRSLIKGYENSFYMLLALHEGHFKQVYFEKSEHHIKN